MSIHPGFLRAAAAALSLMGLLSGCAGQGSGKSAADDKQTHPPARKDVYISDVPVPEGFNIDEKHSMNKVYAKFRYVDHYYQGSGQPQAVRNFYYVLMPEHHWQLVSENMNEGVYQLLFRKGDESCALRVDRGGSGSLFYPCRVRVTIEPYQEPGATPRPQQ